MLRLLAYVSTIPTVFIMSWFLTRLYGPQNCIKSTLVNKIVIHANSNLRSENLNHGGGAASGLQINSCDLQTRLLSPQAPEIIKTTHLFKRIEDIEMLAPYLDFADVPITIRILANSKGELQADGAVLSLSTDVLFKSGVLEKAILFMKLNNNNPMSASVLADFLWQELISHEPLVEKNKTWPLYFKSLRDYCQSVEVLPMHLSFCGGHNLLADSYIIETESDVSAAPWAMKIVYTTVLRELYRSLDILGKQKMLERLIFLGEIDDEFIEERGFSTDLFALDESYSQMFRDWLMPLLLTDERVEKILSAYLFKNQLGLNYLVVGRSSREVFPFEYKFTTDDEVREPLIVQLGTKKYFYPNHLSMNVNRKEIFARKMIKSMVYVSCDMPDVESLLEYSGLTKTVIFVRQCEAEDIDWNLVAKQGLTGYLNNHIDVQFIEFNLSALQLAKRVRGPMHNSENFSLNFSSWQKWLMWQKVINDDVASKVQRPMASIDGVGRFRIF